MVFQRKHRKSKTWEFQGRTRHGWKQVTTSTTNKALAQRIEHMWAELAEAHRAWDILEQVPDVIEIGVLYDHWAATKGNVHDVRRRLHDLDVVPLVDDFLAVYRSSGVKPDSVEHMEYHLRHLLPTPTATQPSSRLASSIDEAWLTEQLAAYEGSPATRRKVHSHWTTFFDWCTRIRKLYLANPMLSVDRPAPPLSTPRFLELEEVQLLVNWQPTAERRAYFALAYGAAIEVTVELALRRLHVNEATHEVRATGTKAHTRDRACLVAEWAWPIVWAHVRTVLPQARLFPESWSRYTVSDWHRETIEALNLPKYPLHNARDHWAVRQVRAGTPIAVVQHQLGHSTPMLTLTKYGAYLPDGVDRAHWEGKAKEYDERRRNAREG